LLSQLQLFFAVSLSHHQTNVISTEGGAFAAHGGEIPVFAFAAVCSFQPQNASKQRQ
jgi:hypothetical protein